MARSLRSNRLDESDIPDVLTFSPTNIWPLNFQPKLGIRQCCSSVDDEKSPLDLLSRGQLRPSTAHRILLVQALVERVYLIERIGCRVYFRLLAGGGCRRFAASFFIQLGACIRLKVLGRK